MANAQGQTVWRWDQAEPFGNNPADENPSGLGAFDLPLRFAGQRYDAETALHYNYFRDYDPSLGAYKQFDPYDQRDGRNGYSYVRSDPLSLIDPFGLQYRRGVRPFDGCGPNGRILENFIPDLFPKCRKDHDECYDDCVNKPTKATCDQTYCKCLRDSCPRMRGGVALPECLLAAGWYCSWGTEGSVPQQQFDEARKNCKDCK